MKILLVQPKMGRRPMDSALKAKMAPSLALLTLKNLTGPVHDVTIVNENVEKLAYDVDADLVGITVTVDTLPRAAAIAERFRRRGVTVVAGGIHITADPTSARPYFDAICTGRAEATWRRLLHDTETGCLKAVYADDLADRRICPPDYDVPLDDRYIYTNVVSTSRGCPFHCDFCYNSSRGSTPFIARPVADVLRDIRAVKRTHILFIDDNFIANPRRTAELLEALLPYHVKWSAAVTANIIDYPDLLDLMARSGCRSLFIGFETLRQASIDQMHKRQNHTDRYAAIVRELHRRGIMVNASIVFGMPGDDVSVFPETLEWMVRHKVETVTAHILTPYPGTALHRRLLDESRIIDEDLSHYNTAHVVFQPDSMTPTELYEGYLGFYRQLYSFRNIWKRLPQKGRRRAYLLFNLGYRKFGRLTDALSHLVPLGLLGRLAASISYR